MKKVLAMVICVAMLACFALTASAESVDATLTVSTVEGKVGDVVSVDIAISEASDIGALEITLAVDESLLKVATKTDKRGDTIYFEGGAAATAAKALVEGSDGIVDGKFMLTTASSDGYYDAGAVWTVWFEIVGELPENGAVFDAEATSVGHYNDDNIAINLTVVDGAVKAAKEEVKPSEPESKPESKPEVKPESKPVVDAPVDEEPTTSETDKENPKTGDVSGIAVAAGLCAVMAAAFVISKKVND